MSLLKQRSTAWEDSLVASAVAFKIRLAPLPTENSLLRNSLVQTGIDDSLHDRWVCSFLEDKFAQVEALLRKFLFEGHNV